MAHIDVFKGWAETIRQDIDAFKALLESKKADNHSKKLAGTALLYLVSRMDLIPDWNEGIGVLDDVMVLRVCSQLAQGHERGALPSSAEVSIERMANEAEKITQFLGGAIYDKLKAYVAKLGDQAVRGRTPTQLFEDEAARKALYVELDDELKKTVPIVINDPKDAELRLKAYLTHKLQS
ncbi:MAG: YkvA family protein [Kofleriaceae bacterium]